MEGSSSNNEEESPPSAAGGSSSPGSAGRRWTCEACGCNTNSESDRSCTICGTSQNNGSSILRRAGYAARASGATGLFARSSVAARRNILNNNNSNNNNNNNNNNDNEHHLPFGSGMMMDGYYHEFFESVMDGDVDMNAAAAAAAADEDDEIAAMAMEVTGVGSSSSSSSNSVSARSRAAVAAIRGAGGGPRSIVDAARSFPVAAREPVQRLEPDELLRAARDNDSVYQPKWMNPSQIGGRMRTGNGIEVGDGANQNVAYLPLGSGEGRALRALEAFPRSAPFASFSLSPSTSSSSTSNNNSILSGASGQERKPRRVFGFKVAFGHPSKENGENMGGCHLIGVTNTSFSSFSEKNALQQSPFFFGIEDGGNKYEGTRSQSSTAREGIRSRRRSTYAVELREDEASRNDDGVLFGSRDVITCVVDLESRTLTFWRDEKGESKLLGTLVTNIPRSGQLYPIVVPYNAGSTVSITGMSGEPLPLLTSFTTSWKQAQLEKEAVRRKQLKADYSVLVQNGSFTPKLTSVLQEIFSRYLTAGQTCLIQIEASRLWYRCGIKLSSLKDIFRELTVAGDIKTIKFEDFYQLLERINADDEKKLYPLQPCNNVNVPSDFQIGEKVELVVGYERFGDAASGPLLPGNRGTIIELQGAQGLRHSIRVIYNSRRWWYQPQALVRENSGLTDSPGIWFMKGILRLHGYDQKTLTLLVGKQVSASSWKVGDLVVPKKLKNADNREKSSSYRVDEAVGKIVPESSISGPLSARVRVSGSVTVEFISKTFAESTSVQTGSSFKEQPFALECRKVSTSRLVHTSAFHGLGASQKPRRGTGSSRSKVQDGEDDINEMDVDDIQNSSADNPISDCVMSDFQMMKYLDASAIERVIKECDKTSTSLITLFEAGLPNFVLEALNCVMQNIQLSEIDESFALAISALGKLALLIAERSFPNECLASSFIYEEGEDEDQQQSSKYQDLHSINVSSNATDDQQNIVRSGGNADPSFEESSRRVTRSSSLMQRRRMLLSLMSRARRSDGDSLGDILSREMHAMPSLEMSADAAAALFFAPPSDGDVNVFGPGDRRDDGRLENSRPIESATSSERLSSVKSSPEETVLDTLLRGRTNDHPTNGTDERCIIPLSSIKNIASMGVLGNSLPWLKSLLDYFVKKIPRKQDTRESSILKSAADDDGMPLLQLAITLGCSMSVIKELIRCGAPVKEIEIQLAADLDLPDILSTLLMHQVYSDGMIDLKNCSSTIAAIVHDARKRQDSQHKRLRKEAESFLVSFSRKLVQICLKRRQQQQGNDTCGRAIACALVGNVELCALRKRHKIVSSTSTSSDVNEESIYSTISERGTSEPCGIMQALPVFILGRSLAEEPSELTNLLLVIEDCLSSKGITDGCVGLTLLLTLLRRFPLLNQSLEMERYGFADFVCSHDALALNQLTEISSRVSKIRLAESVNEEDIFSASEVILCPKKHKATLHVTKHSSFRCDLCGKGVECGAIMFGCRSCDWDKCEQCCDKVEGGIVKWKFVRELASKCQELLGKSTISADDGDTKEEDKIWGTRMVEGLKSMDNASDVNTLSIRLLQRDLDSIQGLAFMLRNKGRVTMHQFLNIILPALHSTLMGKKISSERTNSGRRTKKPRVAGMVSGDFEERMETNEEERLEFAKEILKSLDDDKSPDHNNNSPMCSQDEDHDNEDMQDGDGDGDYDGSDDYEEHDEIKIGQKDEKVRAKQLPELLRRLQKVLSLHEDLSTIKVAQKEGVSSLRSLKKPIKLRLTQQQRDRDVTILVEPLVSVDDLSRQILKTASTTLSEYVNFCRKLVEDSAIILVRTLSYAEGDQHLWRIAKIVSFDEKAGWHMVRYSSSFVEKSNCEGCTNFKYGEAPLLEFEADSTKEILSVKKYVIIYREKKSEKKSAFDMEQLLAEGMVGHNNEGLLHNSSSDDSSNVIGTLVESDIKSSSWTTYTVVAVDNSDKNKTYDLVNDEGVVNTGVPENNVCDGERNDDAEGRPARSNPAVRRSIEARGQLSRTFPFISRRQAAVEGERPDSSGRGQRKIGKRLLKRTWSALASIESMCPVGVSATTDNQSPPSFDSIKFKISLDGRNIDIYVEENSLEFPPSLEVRFSSPQILSPVNVSAPDTTLISLLFQLYQDEECDFFRDDEAHQIFYSVILQPSKGEEKWFNQVPTQKKTEGANSNLPMIVNDGMDMALKVKDDPTQKQYLWSNATCNRSRKLSHATNYSDCDELGSRCDGLDEICIQCIEVIEFLARVNIRLPKDKQYDTSNSGSIFVNQTLSQKLTKQSEDPLFVVGGIAPEWCLAVPAFAPNIFSYASRKLLLDRVAFGVSRSTLRQQDAKVNVGRLRQRMNSLRARAVELMADAFSGDVEDPTALQLQADELYGMEEALATRVRASFRAEGWEEMTLQVAKAAIHRESLLSDAMSIMKQFCSDPRLNRRRLEIRFDGESGFDASTGDEAGVTRGFYADVAESLLSCDLVAGVSCSLSCVSLNNLQKNSPSIAFKHPDEPLKLPLWIPDIDASGKVILPTPRAAPSSIFGIYPRPISPLHPQFSLVLRYFRFMGRLFAAAMRDGFMFPLPLSASFLKLVQNSGEPHFDSGMGFIDGVGDTKLRRCILSSDDLPRPGFIGGEVYATEMHICRALDRIDFQEDPQLSEVEKEREYRQIATDKNFARMALGKNYDCSFDDYFQDRTFVDPLDPTQGIEAHSLCPNGYDRSVTIHNIREWITKAKYFMLHEGVIEQASAFKSGINDFFPIDYLRLFTSEELQHDVCGMGDNVDGWTEEDIRNLFQLGGKGTTHTEALVAVAAIGGNAETLANRRFDPSSSTIKFVVKALLEASPKKRRHFLSFVTSLPIVTPGKLEIVPIGLPMNECCLPRANTCSRRLYLPSFDSYESFSQVFWASILGETKYKGFYEWNN